MSFDSHQTMQHIAHWPVGGISVGINWPWLDDVNGDPTRFKITGQPARHALQGRFAGGISSHACNRHTIAIHGADDSDASTGRHLPVGFNTGMRMSKN